MIEGGIISSSGVSIEFTIKYSNSPITIMRSNISDISFDEVLEVRNNTKIKSKSNNNKSTNKNKFIGGFNMSTMGGGDVDSSVDNLMGFKIGVQQTIANGLIATYSVSQRGFSVSEPESYDYYAYDFETKFNFLSVSLLKPFPMGGFDLLAGGDVGYFLSGEAEMCIDGDCDSEDLDGDDLDNRLDYGLEIGARYKVNNQIGIVGTYYFGLKNFLDEDVDATNRSFQIYATYAL